MHTGVISPGSGHHSALGRYRGSPISTSTQDSMYRSVQHSSIYAILGLPQLGKIPVGKEDVSVCGWFRDNNLDREDILFSWKEYRYSKASTQSVPYQSIPLSFVSQK